MSRKIFGNIWNFCSRRGIVQATASLSLIITNDYSDTISNPLWTIGVAIVVGGIGGEMLETLIHPRGQPIIVSMILILTIMNVLTRMYKHKHKYNKTLE